MLHTLTTSTESQTVQKTVEHFRPQWKPLGGPQEPNPRSASETVRHSRLWGPQNPRVPRSSTSNLDDPCDSGGWHGRSGPNPPSGTFSGWWITPIFLKRHPLVNHPDSRIAYSGLLDQANPDPGCCLFGQTLTGPQFWECPTQQHTSHITEQLSTKKTPSATCLVLCCCN